MNSSVSAKKYVDENINNRVCFKDISWLHAVERQRAEHMFTVCYFPSEHW